MTITRYTCNRVEQFQKWRLMAKYHPAKFRVKIHEIDGGYAFSLLEKIFTNVIKPKDLVRVEREQRDLRPGPGNGVRMIGGRTQAYWQIIAHSDLWLPGDGPMANFTEYRF